MDIDIATLRLAFVVVALTMLALFYFATYRTTRSSYCGWWCIALALFLAGSAAYLFDGTGQQSWANPTGSVLLVLGTASTWAGARTLRAAAPPIWMLLAGPVVLGVFAAADDPGTSVWAGGSLYLLLMSTMFGLSAIELWHVDRGRVAVTTALMLAAATASTFYFFRLVVYLAVGPSDKFFTTFAGSEVATLINTVLLVTVSYGMTALSNQQSTSELRRRATHDGLTNLLNQTEFLARAETELQHLRRTGAPASLVLADLDHFKKVNDEFGHQAGDHVLRAFAATCVSTVRSTDLVGRYGGEEYVLLLPGSDVEDAAIIASNISRGLSTITVGPGQSPSPTASYGIAAVDPTMALGEVIASADAALYEAKATGRDRHVIADRP